MKLPLRFPNMTFKQKLLIYFILIAFIPASLISYFNYKSSSASIENDIGEYNYTTVSNMMELLDKQLEQVEYFTEGILLNQDVLKLLRRTPETAGIEDENWLKVYKDMDQQFEYASITSNMFGVMIIGENGFVNRNGSFALYYDANEVQNSEWYKASKDNRKTMMLFSPIPNTARISGEEHVIPVVRAINDINSRERIGSLVIFLSEKFLSDIISSDFKDKETETYLINSSGQVMSSNRNEQLGLQLSDRSFLKRINEGNESYFVSSEDNKSILVVHKKSSNTGLTLIKALPINSIQQQKKNLMITTLLLLFSTVCIAYLFSLFMTWNFTRPIKKLINNVRSIASGNFNQSLETNGVSELGILGENIQMMASQIKKHIDEKVHEQEEKRKLEIKMLQYQINPHFLYNTLSSIKWMATIQKAEGIEAMAGSLGRLLNSALGDVNEKISLTEELKIVDDYMSIQRIRYKGKVKFVQEVQSEHLLQYAVLKFTLQPLIENAIFHGIEPKKGTGTITISIIKHGENLVIKITDNGIGIHGDRLKEIRGEPNVDNTRRGRSGIGITNVANRVELVYGKGYGMNIISEEGKFTEVTLTIPAEIIRRE